MKKLLILFALIPVLFSCKEGTQDYDLVGCEGMEDYSSYGNGEFYTDTNYTFYLKYAPEQEGFWYLDGNPVGSDEKVSVTVGTEGTHTVGYYKYRSGFNGAQKIVSGGEYSMNVYHKKRTFLSYNFTKNSTSTIHNDFIYLSIAENYVNDSLFIQLENNSNSYWRFNIKVDKPNRTKFSGPISYKYGSTSTGTLQGTGDIWRELNTIYFRISTSEGIYNASFQVN